MPPTNVAAEWLDDWLPFQGLLQSLASSVIPSSLPVIGSTFWVWGNNGIYMVIEIGSGTSRWINLGKWDTTGSCKWEPLSDSREPFPFPWMLLSGNVKSGLQWWFNYQSEDNASTEGRAVAWEGPRVKSPQSLSWVDWLGTQGTISLMFTLELNSLYLQRKYPKWYLLILSIKYNLDFDLYIQGLLSI